MLLVDTGWQSNVFMWNMKVERLLRSVVSVGRFWSVAVCVSLRRPAQSSQSVRGCLVFGLPRYRSGAVSVLGSLWAHVPKRYACVFLHFVFMFVCFLFACVSAWVRARSGTFY